MTGKRKRFDNPFNLERSGRAWKQWEHDFTERNNHILRDDITAYILGRSLRGLQLYKNQSEIDPGKPINQNAPYSVFGLNEFARMMGKTRETMRRFIAEHDILPDASVKHGQIWVPVWYDTTVSHWMEQTRPRKRNKGQCYVKGCKRISKFNLYCKMHQSFYFGRRTPRMDEDSTQLSCALTSERRDPFIIKLREIFEGRMTKLKLSNDDVSRMSGLDIATVKRFRRDLLGLDYDAISRILDTVGMKTRMVIDVEQIDFENKS